MGDLFALPAGILCQHLISHESSCMSEGNRLYSPLRQSIHKSVSFLPPRPIPVSDSGSRRRPGPELLTPLFPHTQEATQIDQFLFSRHQSSLFLICCHHKVHNPALPCWVTAHSFLQDFCSPPCHTLYHTSLKIRTEAGPSLFLPSSVLPLSSLMPQGEPQLFILALLLSEQALWPLWPDPHTPPCYTGLS